MPDDMQPDVRVILTVEVRHPNSYVDEEPASKETFTADINTDGNKYQMARSNVRGLAESASEWLRNREQSR